MVVVNNRKGKEFGARVLARIKEKGGFGPEDLAELADTWTLTFPDLDKVDNVQFDPGFFGQQRNRRHR